MRAWQVGILFVAVVVSFYLTLGFVPLFDLDEGAFSEATREMLQNGDYITTYLNGDFRFDKPILIYWFQLLSVKLFGLNAFAVRLPSAIAATLWVFATYRFVKKLYDSESAFWSALMMLSALQITIIAKAAIADALLNLFIALTLFSIYRYYQTRENQAIYMSFLFMALGALTKGPIAVLIPFAVSLLFFWYKREWRAWSRAIFNPVGIMIFLVVAGPWYVAEYLAQGDRFIEGFFLKHNISRFQGPMEGHYGSLLYYIPVLLLGLLPFTAPILRALWQGLKRRDDVTIFGLIWFGFVFLFFSFSGTKLPHYVIYGYTPLFILGGIAYASTKGSRFDFWTVVVLYLLLLALPIYLYHAGGLEQIRDAYAVWILKDAQGLFDWVYFAVLLTAIGVTLALSAKSVSAHTRAIVSALIFIGVINLVILPLVGSAQQEPIKEAGELVQDRNETVVMYHIHTPSFSFYARKITPNRTPKVGEIALVRRNQLNSFKKFDMIFEKGGVALIKVGEK